MNLILSAASFASAVFVIATAHDKMNVLVPHLPHLLRPVSHPAVNIEIELPRTQRLGSRAVDKCESIYMWIS